MWHHLSAQEIVNWVTTADGCVHTDDTTKLSPTYSCEFVFTPPTPTPTRQNSFVPSASACVLGITVCQQRTSTVPKNRGSCGYCGTKKYRKCDGTGTV